VSEQEEAPLSLGFLLWHATLRWQRMIAAALKPVGLTHVQFVLLAVLWWFVQERGERPTQRALAQQAGTDPMMTSQVIRALEGKGHATRRQHPEDSRAIELDLTPSGKRVAIKAIKLVEAVDANFFAATSDPNDLRGPLLALAGLEGRPVPTVVSDRED
jgi:DNA-binding MarR family transcriptional regulator